MTWIITKYSITAAVVVLISELAKRSDKLGGFVAALPMFLVFPSLLPRWGFWGTLAACTVITLLCFGLFAMLVRRFGIELLP